MRALVTGGAGFIGSHLVDLLVERGHRVRILDDLLPQAHPTGQPRHLNADAELIVGDVRDQGAVDRALENVDTVFHLAGMVGNGQSMFDLVRYTDVNVRGTATLLEALLARRASIRRLVTASSMVVYGDGAYACPSCGPCRAVRPRERLERREWEPICPACGAVAAAVATPETQPLAPNSTYGITKRDQEELSLVVGRAHGLPAIALRYLNTYGSRQALSNPYTGVAAIMAMRLRLGKRPILFEDGRQLRDPIHVRDVAEATLAAAEAPPSALYAAYNVGAGHPMTIGDMARALARAMGVAIEPEVSGEFREGDIRHCFADTSLTERVLGFRAKVRFEEGAGELADWVAHEAPIDNTERANDELRRSGLLR
ncbi:MAG: NAD-dependent epimerase/dehydratase family protein [Polyangiaceae bacterium]